MIKNYTSGVPVGRTIARITEILIQGGAVDILQQFKLQEVSAVCFAVRHPATDKRIVVRLPANVDAVYAVLRAQVKRPRAGTLDKLRDQAARTAWKLMQDWVEVQISLIQMHQAEFLEVFLPYVWNGHTTFFEQLKENKFKLLGEGGHE